MQLKILTQEQPSGPPKDNSLHKTRYDTTYSSLRSVHQLFAQLTLYPTPKILCFTMVFNRPNTKSALTHCGIYIPCWLVG